MQKASLQISGGTTTGDRGVMLAGRDRGAVLRNGQGRPFPEPTRSRLGACRASGHSEGPEFHRKHLPPKQVNVKPVPVILMIKEKKKKKRPDFLEMA